IFRALFNGATVLPFDFKEDGLAKLAAWLIQEEITIYHSVPSAFRYFVGTLSGKEEFPKLRLIHLGGEPVSIREVNQYKKHFSPACILLNNLGATETSVYRQYFINRETQITDTIVPVGYAVEDKEILLLNDAGEEAGANVIGEIAVKSRYRSPGYWRRPDLTQAAFVPDPSGGKERVYRTGDLGRMLSDGCLVYLGRKDSRVKIRGHRIEVAETEMALLDLDTVKEAIVVAQEEMAGSPSASLRTGQRLVAYIVPVGKPTLNVSGLRRALAEKLPDYMIPSAFIMIDALPLTPTGKVDRRALPALGRARPELVSPFVAPRTQVEDVLAGIWAEVLGLDQVGIYDNLFDLGGHSLNATQVISRVINTFKVELPIKSLFESPTVADMAVVITENMAKKAGNKELAHMLAELESISNEEARKRLADEEAKEYSEK
ncbi:MAG: AMP-binding protein, partial [Candidatus Binatia bacterium]